MFPPFRDRSFDEIWRVLKKRKWHVIMPALALSSAAIWTISQTSNTYKSTALLTIKAPKISEKIVQSLSDEDMSQKLNELTQNILSRNNLEQIIKKYNLYAKERAAGQSIESVTDAMRKNITVETEKDGKEKVSNFRITYIGGSPEQVRQITNDLANIYVNKQLKESVQAAENTSEFIDKQLSQAKKNLDEIEQQRVEIMQQNSETLPESSQGLIAQLQGARNREENITKEKETLTIEKGRVNEQIGANNRQIRLIEEYGEKETQDALRQSSQIEDTPAYAQLINKRAELTAQLDNLLKVFKEKHPSVIAKRSEIERVNDEIESLRKNTDKRVQIASQSSTRKAELQKRSLESENQRLQSQVAQIEQQLRYKDEEIQRNNEQIANLEAKLNRVPGIKIALEGVSARYASAKTIYDELLKKYNDSQNQVQRETNSQGETIQVVDQANLPSAPVNTNKKMILMLVSVGLGLGGGLIFAAFFEVPKLFKIQNIEDMKHHTGLKVMFSVPSLLTEKEIRRQKIINFLKWAAGLAASVSSIPLLIVILQKLHIFERLV